MELVSLYGDYSRRHVYVIVEIADFMAREPTKAIWSPTFKTPFQRDLKWQIAVEPSGKNGEANYVKTYLCNPDDKSNDVAAGSKWCIVNDKLREISSSVFHGIKHYSKFKPGGGSGGLIGKREQVRNYLINGAVLVKCRINLMTLVGIKIERTDSFHKKFSFSMKILDTMKSADVLSETVTTPFDENLKWNVDIFPFGQEEDSTDKGYVSVCLNNFEKRNLVHITYNCAITDAEGKIIYEQNKENIDYSDCDSSFGHGFRRFIEREDLTNFLVDGTLHLKFDVTIVKYNRTRSSVDRSSSVSGDKETIKRIGEILIEFMSVNQSTKMTPANEFCIIARMIKEGIK